MFKLQKGVLLILTVVTLTSCSFGNSDTTSTSKTDSDVNSPTVPANPFVDTSATPPAANSSQTASDVTEITKLAVDNQNPTYCQGIADPASAKSCLTKVEESQSAATAKNLDSDDAIYGEAKSQKDPKICEKISAAVIQRSCIIDVVTLQAAQAKDKTKCQILEAADDINQCEGQVDIAVGPPKLPAQ